MPKCKIKYGGNPSTNYACSLPRQKRNCLHSSKLFDRMVENRKINYRILCS